MKSEVKIEYEHKRDTVRYEDISMGVYFLSDKNTLCLKLSNGSYYSYHNNTHVFEEGIRRGWYVEIVDVEIKVKR
jgi:hypothetical protein